MTDGLDDLGDGPYVEGLERFMKSLSREATRSDVGRFMAKERILLPTVTGSVTPRTGSTAPHGGADAWCSPCRIPTTPSIRRPTQARWLPGRTGDRSGTTAIPACDDPSIAALALRRLIYVKAKRSVGQPNISRTRLPAGDRCVMDIRLGLVSTG